MGIQKTFEKIDQAQVVMYLINSEKIAASEIELKEILIEIGKIKNKYPQKPLIIVANKIDKLQKDEINLLTTSIENIHLLSAKQNLGVEALQNKLLEFVNTGALRNDETIVTNSRHYDALLKALEEIQKVQYGIDNSIPSDLMAIDIRQALYHFGEITGEITSDDLLGNIFANFCIGK